MPGMFGNLGVLWAATREARDRTITFLDQNPNGLPADAFVTIVLAAITSEAFINELVESAKLHSIHNKLTPQLQAFVDTQQEIESERGSLKLKYQMAAVTLSGKSLDRGIKTFQDFSTLVTLRNDIVHYKPTTDKWVMTDQGEKVQPPKYILALQQKGIARKPRDGVSAPWFMSIQTAEMAKWSYETAHEIMLAIYNMLPDERIPSGVKWWFGNVLLKPE